MEPFQKLSGTNGRADETSRHPSRQHGGRVVKSPHSIPLGAGAGQGIHAALAVSSATPYPAARYVLNQDMKRPGPVKPARTANGGGEGLHALPQGILENDEKSVLLSRLALDFISEHI